MVISGHMNSTSYMFSFVLGLVVVIVFLVVLNSRFNFVGNLFQNRDANRITANQPTPEPSVTVTPGVTGVQSRPTAVPTRIPAQEFATCDACGYCKTTNTEGTTGAGATDELLIKTEYVIPQGWEACRKCLYPGTTNANNPDARETVKIDPVTGKAPTPAIGRYQTAIGCISASNFRSFGSASGLAQAMLNVVFGITGGIAFIYIFLGSFTILTSRADPEKLNHGRRMLIGAVVGLLFSMGAVFIINFIATNILKIPGFGQ